MKMEGTPVGKGMEMKRRLAVEDVETGERLFDAYRR